MKQQLSHQKHHLTYGFWSEINKAVLDFHFKTVEIEGLEHIPRTGPFLLVSNHTRRWDGLIVYRLINRPANFMVSPNELLGFQGNVLKSMGAFPASSRFDLQAHAERIWQNGEGLVIFPEGDIYKDGNTHPFKSGAARLALKAAQNGINVPIIPVALLYSRSAKSVKVTIAPPVVLDAYVHQYAVEPAQTVRNLTDRLYREVCHLRISLGSVRESVQLFQPRRRWSVNSSRLRTGLSG